MPKRKRSFRRRKGKGKRRRLRRSRRRLGVPRGILPNSRLVKHTYFDQDVYLNPGTGGQPANYVFSCNGMYDPDISGVGHQPLGFDSLTPLYNHYTVIGMKITYQFLTQDNSYTHIVSAKLSTDTTGVTDMTNLIENGKCRWRMVAPGNQGVKTFGRVTLAVNPNRFLAISKPLSEDDLKGTAASNPTKTCYVILSCGPLQGIDSYGVRGTVKIEYTAIWTSPKLLTES